jgi:hypothetical protein
MTQIFRCVFPVFFPPPLPNAHLIFFHQNLINNFQLNDFVFPCSHIAMVNIFNYEFSSLDQIENGKCFTHFPAPHLNSIAHRDKTFCRIRWNLIFARFQMPLHHQQSTTHCELIGKRHTRRESMREREGNGKKNA